MIYALVTYHWRANSIRKRGTGPYDDRFGPTMLCVFLLGTRLSVADTDRRGCDCQFCAQIVGLRRTHLRSSSVVKYPKCILITYCTFCSS